VSEDKRQSDMQDAAAVPDESDSEKAESYQGTEAVAGDAEDDIIDAEVIDEAPAPAPEPGPRPAADHGHAGREKKKGNLAAKAGWSLSALLVAFAAGVYFAPRFDAGLVYLGLRAGQTAEAGRETSGGAGITAASVDLTPIEARLDDMVAALARQQEILAQHEDGLRAAGEARDRLAADVSLLAESGAAAGGATDPAALAAVRAEVERLTNDVARLSTLAGEEDPSVAQLSGALALARAETSQLKGRLKGIEDAMKAVEAGALEASPRGRLVLALGRLKDRAAAGQPYGAPFAALRPDFARLPAIDQQMIGADLALLQENGAGVRSYESLVADFDAVAAEAVKARDAADGGFIANLFTSRRTDAGATGVDAVLLRAERALLARDIRGAVAALETLEGPVLAATELWRSQAATHLVVMRAFDRLTDRVANSVLGPDAAPDGVAPLPDQPASDDAPGASSPVPETGS
jgi:hypothetical protein